MTTRRTYKPRKRPTAQQATRRGQVGGARARGATPTKRASNPRKNEPRTIINEFGQPISTHVSGRSYTFTTPDAFTNFNLRVEQPKLQQRYGIRVGPLRSRAKATGTGTWKYGNRPGTSSRRR